MTTNPVLPTCWIIDHNADNAESLRQLLETGGFGQVLGSAASVADWPGQPVDCLFIRITAWDDYLHWRAAHHRQAPPTIIFLSGRFEKGSRHLGEDLDFHLRPPYQPRRVEGIMRRRIDPDFPRRPLGLFFLNIRYRFQVGGCYTVSGSLGEFQRRLPIPWQRASRSVVAAQCEPSALG